MNKSKLIFEAEFAKTKIQYEINKFICGDPLNEPCYEIGFDYYDWSIEVMLSPYCPLDFEISKELAEYLIVECGFSIAYFNFINDEELHCRVERLQKEEGKWVDNGSFTIGKRFTPSFKKNRLRKYIVGYYGEGGKVTDEEELKLIEAWQLKNKADVL